MKDEKKTKKQLLVELAELRERNAGLEASEAERELLEKALEESEERYRMVADFTYDCELWLGPDKEMLHVSPSCGRITGYPREKFMENPDFIAEIIHKDDLPLWERHMSGISGEEDEFVDFRILHADGRLRWLSQVSRNVFGHEGARLGVRCSMRDITSRKAMERQLRHQALHDPLTGLANRTLCLDRIQRTLERSKRRNHYYAVAFIDLDRFKVINDSLGHACGDKLLMEVGERLEKCVRGLDTVSRFGGDEFILILDELESAKEGVGIVKRVLDDLRRPFFIEGQEVRTSSSIGMVLSPTTHDNPEDMLRNANIAMYRAKGSGRDRIKVFNSGMLEQALQVMTMENDLRRAIEENEFFIQYQPIHRVKDLRLAGFEALVRWRHPRKGVIRPVEFIPAAEESGLIIDLGLWVLEESCETMAAWRESHPGAEPLSLAVNLSARQFTQPDLVEQVARILETAKLPPDRLKLEITESVIMEDAEAALSMLRRLKKIGVRLCIDDFGTGYSSLSYLQRFPVDTLKVDRSFISHMGTDQADIEIVRTVVVLAQSLGMDVIAEGVEKEEQLSVLKALNCEYVQGFYCFEPLDPEESGELIRDLEALLRSCA